MYNIIVNGEVAQTTEYPMWCRWDARVYSYCTCDYDMAEALYVTQEKTQTVAVLDENGADTGTTQEEQYQDSFFADIEDKPQYRHNFPIASVVAVEA